LGQQRLSHEGARQLDDQDRKPGHCAGAHDVATGRALTAPIAAPALGIVQGLVPATLGMPSVDEHLDFWVGGELLPKLFIEVVVAPRHDE
jgi:hypothetical protein